MPSLSSVEAHLVGDIVDEGGAALRFVADMDAEALGNDEKSFYAARCALQNTCEACIRIDGKLGSGRFERLFPGESITAIRQVGNGIRHRYGGADPVLILSDVRGLIVRLKTRAEDLLASHRRLHGADPTVSVRAGSPTGSARNPLGPPRARRDS